MNNYANYLYIAIRANSTYWFHVNHLNDQTGKMSKSKGQFPDRYLYWRAKGTILSSRTVCSLQSHYGKTTGYFL